AFRSHGEFTMRCRLLIGLAVLSVAGWCGNPVLAADAANAGGVKKFVRFQKGDTIAYGRVEGEQVRELTGPFAQWKETGKSYALKELKLLVPSTPTKVLALAGNYQSHLGDRPPFEHPEFFFKPTSCLIPDGANIVLPKDTSDVHYEAE